MKVNLKLNKLHFKTRFFQNCYRWRWLPVNCIKFIVSKYLAQCCKLMEKIGTKTQVSLLAITEKLILVVMATTEIVHLLLSIYQMKVRKDWFLMIYDVFISFFPLFSFFPLTIIHSFITPSNASQLIHKVSNFILWSHSLLPLMTLFFLLFS